MTSSAPGLVDALAVEAEAGLCVLVANLSQAPHRLKIEPLETLRASFRLLDETTAVTSMSEPGRFRSDATVVTPAEGRLTLELAPYAIARIDL